MELVPWRPFGEVGRLRKEMDNLMNRFFDEKAFPRLVAEEWAPAVDISETKDNIMVKAELPGMEAEDVHVSVSEDMLTIKGEKKKEKEEKDESHYYSERYYGSYERSFRLPANVKSDKAEASFDKGILKITLPKVEGAKQKRIEIKTK